MDYKDLAQVQEAAVLRATLAWAENTKACCPNSPIGLKSLPKELVKLAEHDLQSKMAKLNERFSKEAKEMIEKSSNKKMTGDDDKLVELFKIEDEVSLEHGIETEHFLLLRKENTDQEQKEWKANNPEEKDTVQEILVKIEKITKNVQRQPDEMSDGQWNSE